jgi:hypothetical protein
MGRNVQGIDGSRDDAWTMDNKKKEKREKQETAWVVDRWQSQGTWWCAFDLNVVQNQDENLWEWGLAAVWARGRRSRGKLASSFATQKGTVDIAIWSPISASS